MLTYKQLTVRVVPPEQRVGSVSLELCVVFVFCPVGGCGSMTAAAADPSAGL